MINPFEDPIVINHIRQRQKSNESLVDTLYRLLEIKKESPTVEIDTIFNIETLEALKPKYLLGTRLIQKDLYNFNPEIDIGKFIHFINSLEFTQRSSNRKYILILYYLYKYNISSFILSIEALNMEKKKRTYISKNIDEIITSGSSITLNEIGNSGYYAITNLGLSTKQSIIYDIAFIHGISIDIIAVICNSLSNTTNNNQPKKSS